MLGVSEHLQSIATRGTDSRGDSPINGRLGKVQLGDSNVLNEKGVVVVALASWSRPSKALMTPTVARPLRIHGVAPLRLAACIRVCGRPKFGLLLPTILLRRIWCIEFSKTVTPPALPKPGLRRRLLQCRETGANRVAVGKHQGRGERGKETIQLLALRDAAGLHAV